MASNTVTAPKVVENDIEVFARTVPELTNERCDACGGTVAARYVASRAKSNLYFCGHHIRNHEAKLRTDGYTISPDDTSFNAGTAKA